MKGVMIILKPTNNVFSLQAIIPLISALMFALYRLLTRYAARQDSAMTSFFWTWIIGAIVMSVVGSSYWVPLESIDWAWLGLLCILACLAHYLLINHIIMILQQIKEMRLQLSFMLKEVEI